jgi:hypothetical protein
MVQMIANAALIQGTITAIENYVSQEGFFIITLIVNTAGEKKGANFFGDEIANKEIKILLSATLQKKLKLKPAVIITGEIKKINPFLWRAVEDTFQLSGAVKKAAKKDVKKNYKYE